jgi:sugar O-acyltransferase (sialic acid O-acetyltransferase NeuD family)
MGMGTEKIAILGFSEASLTLIFDILESQCADSEIFVINNLNIIRQKPIDNLYINFKVIDSLPENFNGRCLIGPINVNSKLKLFNHYNFPSDKFISIRHQFTVISSTVKVGYGCIFNAGTIIAGQSLISDFVYLNRNISIGHHTKIGTFTTINPASNIAGNVTIGDQCQIGMGVNIVDGVSIGNNTIIGAGSLVLKDIPNNCIAYGNPCKIIKENQIT